MSVKGTLNYSMVTHWICSQAQLGLSFRGGRGGANFPPFKKKNSFVGALKCGAMYLHGRTSLRIYKLPPKNSDL
jgi:hypothetical protein